ncbi:aminoglycoside phosphotransferase family protein [Micromonospora sp. NPDC049559]|uniref:phosphotransferase family protein n=1 Tax=Micromonospora sp. NPDC049559 TaxID=3155923 RepID=UPI00343E95B5
MPAPVTKVPVELLAALRRAHSGPSAGLDGALLTLSLRPLSGGRQNHVYLWTPHGGPEVVVKLYHKADDRRRVDREWAALSLLATHRVRDVPVPLWIDPDPNLPALGMTPLHGEPLCDAADRRTALQGLAYTTARIQAVPLAGLLADLPRIDSADHYIHRLRGPWPELLAAHGNDRLTPIMQHLLTAWRRSGDGDLLSEPAAPVFSRGDSNLLNWLRTDGGASACVDFEFSGYSDVAFDAADLIEHISSRSIPDTIWTGLLPELGVDHTNHPRFTAAQRTCALRWLAILWKQRERRVEEFTAQHERVELLFSTANPYIQLR